MTVTVDWHERSLLPCSPVGIPFGRSGLPPRMRPLSGLPVHRFLDGRRHAVHGGVGSSLVPILWSG